MRSIPFALCLALVSLAGALAAAQDVSDVVVRADTPSVVSIGTSMDPAIMMELGYTRRIGLALGEAHRDLALSAEWAVIPGLGSWDAELGGSARVRDVVGPDVLVHTSLTLKRVENPAHEGFAYGYDVGIAPGYYGQRWYVATELALRQMFAMSITHTDAYRALYPEAEDGTYMLGGFNTFVGVGAGTQIFERGMVGLRVAWRSQNLFEDYTPYYAPYTVSMQVGYRF